MELEKNPDPIMEDEELNEILREFILSFPPPSKRFPRWKRPDK